MCFFCQCLGGPRDLHVWTHSFPTRRSSDRGDWVEMENTVKGRIVEIGWRTTRLQTRDQTYMILPNSQIARQRLTNYSAPRRHYRAQEIGRDTSELQSPMRISYAVFRL